MCYGFPVKEINYKNKEKEVITINSFNEQTAGQAGRRSRAPEQGAGAGLPNGLTIKRHN